MVVLARAFSWSIDTNGCMLANSGGVITCAPPVVVMYQAVSCVKVIHDIT